jgi:hypothetical protein
MSPKPAKSKICRDKEKLSKKLLEAVSQVTALQNEHSSNLINGGDGLPRIELAIEAARKKWEKARNAYTAHLREHGC